jgi:CheY-like chemotaxis protein
MAKILIVDDDPDLVEATQLVLENAGYTVGSANSRAEAMQVVQTFDPDLILLDVMMDEPDDGFTLAQVLRDQGLKTPIIMLTSIAKVTGLQYGVDRETVPVDDFEEKPIKSEKLLAKIRQFVG